LKGQIAVGALKRGNVRILQRIAQILKGAFLLAVLRVTPSSLASKILFALNRVP